MGCGCDPDVLANRQMSDPAGNQRLAADFIFSFLKVHILELLNEGLWINQLQQHSVTDFTICLLDSHVRGAATIYCFMGARVINLKTAGL